MLWMVTCTGIGTRFSVFVQRTLVEARTKKNAILKSGLKVLEDGDVVTADVVEDGVFSLPARFEKRLRWPQAKRVR